MKLARLARLQLTDDEVTSFQEELGAVLEYVEQLQNVDVADLQPTAQVSGVRSVMRPDEDTGYGASREALLKNLPATQKGYIKVRRMIR